MNKIVKPLLFAIICVWITIVVPCYYGYKMGRAQMVNDICNQHEYSFCKLNESKPNKSYTYEPKGV